MPSDEKNVVEVPNGKKSQKSGEKKKKTKITAKQVGWVFGIVVLILISLGFVLPATGFTTLNDTSVVFGKYDGKKIELKNGNFFYYQLNNIANYYAEQNGGSIPSNAYFQIYYTAFQNAVVYEALNNMADKAGVKASKEAVADGIVSSGYWNNSDGEFDTERYNAASKSDKEYINSYVSMALPFQSVESDIANAKLSTAETEFIENINSNTASFEYIIIGSDAYGDEEAIQYANNNPAPFVQIGLSILSYSTEDEANDILAKLNAGTMTFAEAADTSIDGYAEKDGVIGLVFKHALDSTLSATTDASDVVFSTPVGSLVGPYQTGAGYSIFRVDSAPSFPETLDEEVLSHVKEYIAENDSQIMTTYLAAIAQDVYQNASSDFDAAADKYDLTISSVSNVAENPGDSQFIASFNYSDYSGLLSNAISSDETLEAKLFGLSENSVLEPILSGSSYIVVRRVESTSSNYMASYISAMYSQYASQLSLSDMQNSILTSDKLTNDFYTVFLDKVMGMGSTK